MSDSLTVLVSVCVYALLVSVYVGQSHCVGLCLVMFQSMSDSLTVLVSVYVGQSHCVSLCLVSFSLCRTVSLCWFQSGLTVLVYSLLFSLFTVLVSVGLCRTVSLC